MSTTPSDGNGLEKVFPRGISGRIALGLASLTLGPPSGMAAFVLLRNPRPADPFDALGVYLASSLLLAMAQFFACGLIWALAMPHWLERYARSAATRLALAMFFFLLGLTAAAFWAFSRV